MTNKDDKPAELEQEATVAMERTRELKEEAAKPKPQRRLSAELTAPIGSNSRDETVVAGGDAPDAQDVDEEGERKALHGPLRRNWPLLLVVGAALIVGPVISDYLESYRAIVIQVDDDMMRIIEGRTPLPPPEWVESIGVEPGTMIEKKTGEWAPKPTAATTQDRALTDMFARYMKTYTGVIKEIRPPYAPGGPSVAVVTTDDGETLEVELWSGHLVRAAVGKGVKKVAESWEPELVERPKTEE